MASFAGLAIVLLVVLVVRLWFLQVIGGAGYQERAEANRLRTVITEAPRGAITDRNGKALVTSKEVLNLVAQPQDLVGDAGARTLTRLSAALGHPAGYFAAKVARAQKASPFEAVVLEEDASPQLQAYVEERRAQLPGIDLQSAYKREYPNGTMAAHLLGYTGPIPAESARKYRDQGYLGNETVGRAGIESQYEEYLRGIAGRQQVEVDARGDIVGRGVISQTSPRPGQTLRLSIDLSVQKALERALAREVGDDNITVNAITPGFTASETQVGGSDPAYMARMAAMNERKALKRTQMPEDLVGVLLFLLSDASAYITGQTVNVDGGAMMH